VIILSLSESFISIKETPKANSLQRAKSSAVSSIMRIILTETESKIQSLLIHAASKLSQKVELRLAGGWVRDKVL
jgi:hypothetical protein